MYELIPILTFASTATAACTCGYSVNNTDDVDHAVFTDLLESDFLHMTDLTSNRPSLIGWQPQNYNQPPIDGLYGIAPGLRNLVPNYIPDRYNWFGEGVNGGDPGLQLWVRSDMIHHGGHDFISSAEIVSERDDILYGSFRIAMKTTGVSGTCGAFYFYRNDSQEIDIEVLSHENQQSSENGDDDEEGFVHFVVQNTNNPPDDIGDDDEHKSRQLKYSLSPSTGPADVDYNEYRFDWLPDRIEYFVNGQSVWIVTDNIPSTPGKIHISHWSNGDAQWSQGPPNQDVVMTVSYVKAYFNSTNSTREAEYNTLCSSSQNPWVQGEVCQIADQTTVPSPMSNKTGYTYFFTLQANMTVNQTIYDNSAEQSRSGWTVGLIFQVVFIAITLFSFSNLFIN